MVGQFGGNDYITVEQSSYLGQRQGMDKNYVNNSIFASIDGKPPIVNGVTISGTRCDFPEAVWVNIDLTTVVDTNLGGVIESCIAAVGYNGQISSVSQTGFLAVSTNLPDTLTFHIDYQNGAGETDVQINNTLPATVSTGTEKRIAVRIARKDNAGDGGEWVDSETGIALEVSQIANLILESPTRSAPKTYTAPTKDNEIEMSIGGQDIYGLTISGKTYQFSAAIQDPVGNLTTADLETAMTQALNSAGYDGSAQAVTATGFLWKGYTNVSIDTVGTLKLIISADGLSTLDVTSTSVTNYSAEHDAYPNFYTRRDGSAVQPAYEYRNVVTHSVLTETEADTIQNASWSTEQIDDPAAESRLIYVEEYVPIAGDDNPGADEDLPTGNSVDTDAILLAIDAVKDTGGTLIFSQRDWIIDMTSQSSFPIFTTPVRVEGRGANFKVNTDQEINSLFRWLGSEGSSATLTADVLAGETVVEFNNDISVEAGDWIYLTNGSHQEMLQVFDTIRTGGRVNNVAGYSAGATTMEIDSTSEDPTAGWTFQVRDNFEGEPQATTYTVTSYIGGTLNFTPGLEGSVADDATLLFRNPTSPMARLFGGPLNDFTSGSTINKPGMIEGGGASDMTFESANDDGSDIIVGRFLEVQWGANMAFRNIHVGGKFQAAGGNSSAILKAQWLGNSSIDHVNTSAAAPGNGFYGVLLSRGNGVRIRGCDFRGCREGIDQPTDTVNIGLLISDCQFYCYEDRSAGYAFNSLAIHQHDTPYVNDITIDNILIDNRIAPGKTSQDALGIRINAAGTRVSGLRAYATSENRDQNGSCIQVRADDCVIEDFIIEGWHNAILANSNADNLTLRSGTVSNTNGAGMILAGDDFEVMEVTFNGVGQSSSNDTYAFNSAILVEGGGASGGMIDRCTFNANPAKEGSLSITNRSQDGSLGRDGLVIGPNNTFIGYLGYDRGQLQRDTAGVGAMTNAVASVGYSVDDMPRYKYNAKYNNVDCIITVVDDQDYAAKSWKISGTINLDSVNALGATLIYKGDRAAGEEDNILAYDATTGLWSTDVHEGHTFSTIPAAVASTDLPYSLEWDPVAGDLTLTVNGNSETLGAVTYLSCDGDFYIGGNSGGTSIMDGYLTATLEQPTGRVIWRR